MATSTLPASILLPLVAAVLLGGTVTALGEGSKTRDPMVDVATVAPHVREEMRYALKENFLHAAVYPCARCLLRQDAAEALREVQSALEKQGLGLKVWDCYRPHAVQEAMWKILPDARFVANPAKGSVHNRGGAVDITLVDSSGKALEMPTPHDDFSEKAYADAPASPEATRNRATLRKAMEAGGFHGIKTEWWHFDFGDSKQWPMVDAPLCPTAPPSGS